MWTWSNYIWRCKLSPHASRHPCNIFAFSQWVVGPGAKKNGRRRKERAMLAHWAVSVHPWGSVPVCSMKPSPTLMNCALSSPYTWRNWITDLKKVDEENTANYPRSPTPNPCIFHVILLSGKKITALFFPIKKNIQLIFEGQDKNIWAWL